jgi:hypothetical protein
VFEAGRTAAFTEGGRMIAAIGFGVIGTIIVVALIIAVIVWLLRRA